ncbi:MAG: Smr/MutS family protein [Ferruginibacter sp.]
MKYEVGDKILVLATDEEGKVVELMNEKMVMIEVRGVKFPAYMDQIDFPYFKMFSKKKTVEKKNIYVDNIKREKAAVKKKIGDGVFLNFLPVYDKDIFDDDVVEKLKIYLINQNEEGYDFIYNLLFNGESSFNLKASIGGLSEFYLHDVSFEDMGESPKFEFDFSLIHPDKKKAPGHEVFLKISGKKLFKKIEETQANNDASFKYELFTHYPERVDEEKVDMTRLGNAGFRVYNADKIRENLSPARSVIDLHIEKLTDHWQQLTNFEILTTQLIDFEKYYELAVAHKQATLIVIHGVGEGILRNEIHDILKLKKEVKSFVNQFHPLYGYGATEIYFK